MELELKYNRNTKRKGITGEKFIRIYIYSFSSDEKKIDPSCGKWNGSPSISLLSTHWKGERNERERNSIAGGDDRRRIVVHENIARLTVNDFAWSSGSLVVDDFNRRPSTGKKAHRPERNSERRKRTDFPIFRYGSRSTESSRGKYDVLYELNVACRAHVV